MNFRSNIIFIFLILILLAHLSGCTSIQGVSGNGTQNNNGGHSNIWWQQHEAIALTKFDNATEQMQTALAESSASGKDTTQAEKILTQFQAQRDSLKAAFENHDQQTLNTVQSQSQGLAKQFNKLINKGSGSSQAYTDTLPSDTESEYTTASTVPVTSEPTVARGVPLDSGIASELASVNSNNPIWQEAYRMLLNTRYTKYVHPPDYKVDDANGIYEFDCDGFVTQVLMNVDLGFYQKIGKRKDPIPVMFYITYFNSLNSTKPSNLGWTRVAHPLDLKAGDVCVWPTPDPSDPHKAHVFIIAGVPGTSPTQSDEVLVRVIDSVPTGSEERVDTRNGSPTGGLGSGILGLMVDGEGNPFGYNWNEYTSPVNVAIVCGRLNK